MPGKIVSVAASDTGARLGRVDFGGIAKEVSLDFVPEAGVGDYVIVHVGFALSKVDPEEAQQVFEYLKQMDELNELNEPSQRSETSPPPAPGSA